jgi:hypothetical protein
MRNKRGMSATIARVKVAAEIRATFRATYCSSKDRRRSEDITGTFKRGGVT